MKFAPTCLLFIALAVTFANAQSNNLPHVQHVIIVVQENRTPTSLFQQDQALIANGAHIVSQGQCLAINGTTTSLATVQLSPVQLGVCWDMNHVHADWKGMWAGGAMTAPVRTP
jgi:hypothetical protein